jgi:hypothetical protein
MKIKSEILLEELENDSLRLINSAQAYLDMSEKELNFRKEIRSWSILECFEHLNLYSDFYLPEIKSRLNQADKKSDSIFKSGILGNYFAKTMLPGEKMSKMKTFKDKNPLGSKLDKSSIEKFISDKEEFIALYRKSKDYSLNGIKSSISISSIMKLKLGDTFRFLLNHEKRHFAQMEDILEVLKTNKVPSELSI